jgi:hypothetical protein
MNRLGLNETDQPGHADESTTARHYVQGGFTSHRTCESPSTGRSNTRARTAPGNDEGPRIRMIVRLGPFGWQ